MIVKLSHSENLDESGVGYLLQRSVSETYQIHTHDFCEFFYIIKGRAIHNVNGENHLLSEGDFVFIRPDDVHKYDFLNNFDFELISVGFELSACCEALEFMGVDKSILFEPNLPPSISLRGFTQTEVVKSLKQIPLKNDGYKRKTYFRSVLPSLLYLFVQEETVPMPIPRWLANLVDDMCKEENFLAGLPKMISLSGVSQEHLTRQFRKYLDMSPIEFINLKRIGLAAKLLTEGNHEILEVCYACGFNNLSHFYHCFKKQYGCTPKTFAAERQGKDRIC